MKSEIKEIQKEEKKEYPKLMKAILMDNIVVLFTDKRTGFVVHDPKNLHEVGDYSLSWNHNEFQPFDGQIILSND